MQRLRPSYPWKRAVKIALIFLGNNEKEFLYWLVKATWLEQRRRKRA